MTNSNDKAVEAARELVEAYRQTLHTMALEDQALTDAGMDRLLYGMIADHVGAALKKAVAECSDCDEYEAALKEKEALIRALDERAALYQEEVDDLRASIRRLMMATQVDDDANVTPEWNAAYIEAERLVGNPWALEYARAEKRS